MGFAFHAEVGQYVQSKLHLRNLSQLSSRGFLLMNANNLERGKVGPPQRGLRWIGHAMSGNKRPPEDRIAVGIIATRITLKGEHFIVKP